MRKRRTASAKCQRVCDIEQEHQGDWIRGTRERVEDDKDGGIQSDSSLAAASECDGESLGNLNRGDTRSDLRFMKITLSIVLKGSLYLGEGGGRGVQKRKLC